ncbi:ABC transporter substrate-binding protein [Nguyenibacter vanlangensis]|uniref:ABC transporter substrate-binding protein n=1 Tax=Nguyenibacter vanlangensis TaxID=1216886 RepID=A0ABZ3D6Z7_9PROT
MKRFRQPAGGGSVRRSLVLHAAAFLVTLAACPVCPSRSLARGLTVMLAEPPRSMDPADQNATATRSILAPFYESLVRQDADGSIRPWLATAWSVSPDGMAWIFALRPGIVFHDGTPCDADAVVASLRRLLDPGAALAGAGAFRATIASVRRQGASVVITLIHPYADLLSLLSITQAAIVSPLAAARGTLGRHADGTGPFMFVDWQDGAHVGARANPRYWGAPPALTRIEWVWSSEPSVTNMALQTGDADAVMPLAPVFAGLYASGQPAAARAVIHGGRGAAQFWAALNTTLPPLDDARVRRALGLAIDRQALVAGLLHGYGRPACHALTPDIAGSEPCAPGQDRADPAAARALLQQAGLARGFSVTVVVQEPEEPIAEALQAMWRRIGVTLRIRRQEAGVWVQSAFAGPADKARQDIGMVLTSWSAPFIADLQLRPLYASASAAPAGANLGFYRNREIDAAIDRAARTGDPAARARDYAAIQDRLARDAPILPLYVQDNLYGVRQGLDGVQSLPDGEIAVTSARWAAP